ncbi:MAG: hypothetical protein PHW63_10585, partial [Alphaproteobacteria bacterium]|nr:hypothetical protein [Alphaproteobacteria bacterium]
MNTTAQEYMEKGWTAPLPLPAGEKFPPPLKTTGNIPVLKPAEIEKLWNGVGDDFNLGLRVQVEGDHDVISLDVDHYEEKQGRVFLTDMEHELGQLDLDTIPRSTRRGVESPSAQFFFRVPRGVKWKASACSDVDIVQLTHRYAAVYPSEINGMRYTWYQGNDEIEIPRVEDLPILPDRWVSYLKKGSVGKLTKSRKGTFVSRSSQDNYREAVNWLRTNISGWDSNENMSQSLKKVSDSEEFLANLDANGHDTMVSSVHGAIMLGVEGHLGLKAALYKIEKNFVNAVSIVKARRSEADAKNEFRQSVIGEVERLIGEISDGNVSVVEYGAELALPGFHDLLIKTEAAKRPKDADLTMYSNTDLGHAEMLRDYWGKDLLTVAGATSDQEFAFWTPQTGRFHFKSKKQTLGLMEPAVASRIDFEADKTMLQAEALANAGEERQLKPDELDPDEMMAMAVQIRKRANNCRQTSVQKNILEQMHGFDSYNINLADFDNLADAIGLKGGEVLDLLSLRRGDEEIVRKGMPADLITKNTAVYLVPGAQSDAWDEFLDDFLPNKELRRFVQKAIGYSIVSGNPDKKIIFLWGPSNTGKTTILEACGRALGDYAGPMNAIKLFGGNSSGPSPEMVESLNKRMVFMSEVGDDHNLSANAVKRVTGNDTQHTRQLHSNVMRSAAPKFTPYISTNSVPSIKGVDSATRERIMVIPFNEVHARKRI